MKFLWFSVGAVLSIAMLAASVWLVDRLWHPAESFYLPWFASIIVIDWARDFQKSMSE